LITTPTPNAFSTAGYSVNVDYLPFPNAVIRLEGKTYKSKDKIFIQDNSYTASDLLITAAIAASF
jgi:hypothetical protein